MDLKTYILKYTSKLDFLVYIWHENEQKYFYIIIRGRFAGFSRQAGKFPMAAACHHGQHSASQKFIGYL